MPKISGSDSENVDDDLVDLYLDTNVLGETYLLHL
jgi:hypothetical protein